MFCLVSQDYGFVFTGYRLDRCAQCAQIHKQLLLCWVLSKVVYMQRLRDFWQLQTCKKFVNLLVHYFLINFALMKLPVHDYSPRTLVKVLISLSSIIGTSKSSTIHMQTHMYTIDTIWLRMRPKRGQLFSKIASGQWDKWFSSLNGLLLQAVWTHGFYRT